MRFDRRSEPDALREHVLHVGLPQGVRDRQPLQLALSPEENGGVAGVAAVKTRALDDHGAYRTGEFGGAVALQRFLVQLVIDLRGELGERAPCAPQAWTHETMVAESFHDALRGG